MEFQINLSDVAKLNFERNSSGAGGDWSLDFQNGTHQPMVEGANGSWPITLSGESVSSALKPPLNVNGKHYTELTGSATFNSNNQIDGGHGHLQYDDPPAGEDTWNASASMGEEHHHGHRHEEAKA
jgi:hypothetical protein